MLSYLEDHEVLAVRKECKRIFDSPEEIKDLNFCRITREKCGCGHCFFQRMLKMKCLEEVKGENAIRYGIWSLHELLMEQTRVVIKMPAILENLKVGYTVYIRHYLGVPDGVYFITTMDGKNLTVKSISANGKSYSVKFLPYCFFNKKPSETSYVNTLFYHKVDLNDFLYVKRNVHFQEGFYQVIKKGREKISIAVGERNYTFDKHGCLMGEYEQILFHSKTQADVGNYLLVIGKEKELYVNIFVDEEGEKVVLGKKVDAASMIINEKISGFLPFGMIVFSEKGMDFVKRRN